MAALSSCPKIESSQESIRRRSGSNAPGNQCSLTRPASRPTDLLHPGSGELEALMRRSITCGDGGPLGHDLSCREREVLTLLVQRLTDKEIAGVLSISPRTVMSHVTSILTKLGAANRRE